MLSVVLDGDNSVLHFVIEVGILFVLSMLFHVHVYIILYILVFKIVW